MDNSPILISFITIFLCQSLIVACSYCGLSRRISKLEIKIYTAIPPLSASIASSPYIRASAPVEPTLTAECLTQALDGTNTQEPLEDIYVGGMRFN